VRSLPSIRRQLGSFADPARTEGRFRQLRENLRQLATQVQERAPCSRLVFVDYLTVLPPDASTPTGRLPAEVADWARGIAARMSQITQETAAEAGAGFVPAGAASADHHAWSADPWTNQFQLRFHDGAPYHPKAAGMAAVAGLVAEQLGPAPN
jgi:lysophospholipase L1-like esterase